MNNLNLEQKLDEKRSFYYFNFNDSFLLKIKEMNRDYKIIPYKLQKPICNSLYLALNKQS